jgi:hypothetical protein
MRCVQKGSPLCFVKQVEKRSKVILVLDYVNKHYAMKAFGGVEV